MPDFAARVDALSGEGAENGGPIRRPCFVVIQMRSRNEFGDALGEFEDDGNGFGTADYAGVVPVTVKDVADVSAGGQDLRWLGRLLLRPSSPRTWISSLIGSSPHTGGRCKVVRQRDSRFEVIRSNDWRVGFYSHLKDVKNILRLCFVTV